MCSSLFSEWSLRVTSFRKLRFEKDWFVCFHTVIPCIGAQISSKIVLVFNLVFILLVIYEMQDQFRKTASKLVKNCGETMRINGLKIETKFQRGKAYKWISSPSNFSSPDSHARLFFWRKWCHAVSDLPFAVETFWSNILRTARCVTQYLRGSKTNED